MSAVHSLYPAHRRRVLVDPALLQVGHTLVRPGHSVTLQMFLPGAAEAGEPQPGPGLLSLLGHSGGPRDHQVLQGPAQVHL